ncbi:MAG TPA: serine hydrolase [Gaiellales bacterium]|nr:serine hydrolase [Gaiellales bacterium]
MAAPASRPTLDTWMRAPGNRWAFRHVRELIPTARIRHGTPRELPAAFADDLLDAEIIPAGPGDISVRRFLEQSHGDAFSVLRDGRLVCEWYAPGVDPDEPHILMSVTKSITALLAGVLAGEGLLDLDAPTSRYVPEAAGSCFETATVRHLLDMTVGSGFVEDYSPGPDVHAYRQSTGWYRREGDGPALHEYLCSIPRLGAHGGDFRYLSPNTDMLGWVCERAGGIGYADAVSSFLWVPMGAEADADVTVDRLGAARAAGGMSVTIRDLARVGQLVAEAGAGVVPEWFVRDLCEGGAPVTGTDLLMFPGGGYRSSWYQPRWEAGVVAAIGIHGQSIYVDPGRNVVVVKQSSWPEPVVEADELLAVRAARAIAHATG